MVQDYLGVFFIFIFAALLTALMLVLAQSLGPKKPSAAKNVPYETGKDPFSLPGKLRIPVHFYVVAMIFIIFDVEIAFLFPWAVLFKQLGWTGFISILVFTFFILLAYIYAWKNKSIEVN